MTYPMVGKILWLAVDDPVFRKHLRENLGFALAEAGFVISDDEMAVLREKYETLIALDERRALERISAMARGYPR